MITFPKEPRFICRKCFHTFTLNPSSPLCPTCGHAEKIDKNLINFFKFYPRMVAAIPAMDKNGFKWVDYSIYKRPDINIHGFDTLILECANCGIHNKAPIERVAKYAQEPGLLYCHKCKTNPDLNKVSKEFFISISNIHKAVWLIVKFQWDLFSSVGLEPGSDDVLFGAFHIDD
ncbi:MAG: hydrogenase maturation nickel metallochaperone HypA [Desulfuromusa sp.]|nr:hydrogenase maturation nickel metallochaperone HypA [Desulfuromusa sp.]